MENQNLSAEFRHIVRVAGTDIDGSKKLAYGLAKIRGLGVSLSNALIKACGLDPNLRFGYLTDADVQRIELALENPSAHGVPEWVLNRQKELESGRATNLVGANLTLAVKSDIELMKQMRSWKGVRHSLGLKVRGQRTKTTGRTGRTVGVRKKLVGAAAAEKKT
jgi:small subunit ribosomal protein S13